jgi:hypothetical protein
MKLLLYPEQLFTNQITRLFEKKKPEVSSSFCTLQKLPSIEEAPYKPAGVHHFLFFATTMGRYAAKYLELRSRV